jgi:hypothetical protein
MSNEKKKEIDAPPEGAEPAGENSGIAATGMTGKANSEPNVALPPNSADAPGWSMWLVVGYLIAILMALFVAVWSVFGGYLYAGELNDLLKCCLFGGIGGCLYCLRAVYLNACVRNEWASHWIPWYFIRPVVSCISGGAAFVFLKAGLLVLESAPGDQSSGLGFLALAFIAGLNVDKFIGKLEDIAQSVWGIEKSRASKGG